MLNNILNIIYAIVIVGSISLISRYYTKSDTPWFKCVRPKITPPNIMFPIVWSIIYFLLIIALARILILQDACILAILLTNLGLSALWCYLYFEKRYVVDALMIMFILWISIILIMMLSSDKIVIGLMVPYFIWITFAMTLNALTIQKLKECNTKN